MKRARETPLSEFQRIYPHLFLFKHAKGPGGAADTRAYIDHGVTRTTDLNFDPIPGECRIVVLEKKKGNPFPDRLTIGRSVECDVVIRLAFISKVHAHLFVQGGKLTLRDNNASNSTFHNRKKLDPGGACSVKLGDTVSFGGLDFELMDAARLHEYSRSNPLLTWR